MFDEGSLMCPILDNHIKVSNILDNSKMEVGPEGMPKGGPAGSGVFGATISAAPE